MISEELIERLLTTHESVTDGEPLDRRRGVRHALNAPAILHALENGRILPPVPVTVSDISTSGLGLVVVKGTPLTDEWLVSLALADSDITFRCRMVRRSPSGPEHETVGARLIGVLRPGTPVVAGSDLMQFERNSAGARPAWN